MLYFREWGFVRKACKAAAVPVPDRHELHRRALGRDRSSKDFSNEEFDKVLAEFRAISQPASVNAQLRQQRQPRTRLEFSLDELLACIGLYVADAEAYAAGICLDKYGTPDFRDLSDVAVPHKRNPKESSSPLDQFRWTLARSLNGKTGLRNKAGDSLHDMKMKAGLPCHCATYCAKRGVVLVGAEEEMEEQPF
jgi:uncharacterized protein YjiS (DUF1127 family)